MIGSKIFVAYKYKGEIYSFGDVSSLENARLTVELCEDLIPTFFPELWEYTGIRHVIKD
jgi:hypothetical protein